MNYSSNKGDVFVQVFTIFWSGALVISVNNQMLGAVTTHFQTVCYLGYCMFPINIIALLFNFVSLNFLVEVGVILLSSAWATKCKCVYVAAFDFLKNKIVEEKKILLCYPLGLFYLFLAWFVLTASIAG